LNKPLQRPEELHEIRPLLRLETQAEPLAAGLPHAASSASTVSRTALPETSREFVTGASDFE
jgi:hypothetical protein